jgi:DNA repair exonuclease SbcCD ATPase subunit
MRIDAIRLHEAAGWPGVELTSITSGLNAIVGRERAGKSATADFLAHALFGKLPSQLSLMVQGVAPMAEVVVESGARRFRVRRTQDSNGAVRLTVAALDGSPVDPQTIQKLVRGLSPAVLSPLCAVSFRETPDVSALVTAEFTAGWQFLNETSAACNGRRTVELAARRDLLAQELETRIAGERRLSKELETRWREIDRLTRDEQQRVASLEQRLKGIETALAETDGRLRYRRLELNVESRWQPAESRRPEPALAALDEQVTRWRAVLADLAEREANARARLAQLQSTHTNSAVALTEQQAWLAVTRQIAADLSGEVARFARASASDQCVCGDAHPRLRPIAETIDRQLHVLEALIAGQQGLIEAADLRVEIDHLAGSQAELRRHVDHLLERRETLVRRSVLTHEDSKTGLPGFSAVDAEQLETRRAELEQQRFELVEQLRSHQRVFGDLREQRLEVERQRAALLSTRSIEHVQRELAAVQQKLEQAAARDGQHGDVAQLVHIPPEASDFLAQLTDGRLVRLTLSEHSRRACVVNRAGETVPVDSLTPTERDQVYLSLCLGLLSVASRHGIWLPLVLDEPFERLDPHSTAALAAVLDYFGRQGHQVLVFTGNHAAASRLASVGASMHDVRPSRQLMEANASGSSTTSTPKAIRPSTSRKRRTKIQNTGGQQSPTQAKPQAVDGPVVKADRSDAA